MSKATNMQTPRKRTWPSKLSYDSGLFSNKAAPINTDDVKPAPGHGNPDGSSTSGRLPTFQYAQGDLLISPEAVWTRFGSTSARKKVRDVYAKEYRRQVYLRQARESNYWDKARPYWDGGFHKRKYFFSTWTRVARFMAKHMLPLISYIQFICQQGDGEIPNPDWLLCEESVDGYREHIAEAIAEADSQLNREMDRLSGKYLIHDEYENKTTRTLWALHCADPSDLFQYAARKLLKLETDDEEYTLAVFQYLESPTVYEQAWKKVLPPDFGRNACKIYLEQRTPWGISYEGQRLLVSSRDEPNLSAPARMEAQSAVSGYKITAIGKRPVDYIGRDLMIQSLIRSPYGKQFQSLCRKPLPWMEGLVNHLPEEDRRQALSLVVLHNLHLRQLAPYISFLEDEDEENEFDQRFRPVWDCTPCGAIFEKIGEKKAQDLHTCKQARLCPWCHTRKVTDLYQRLEKGPLAQSDAPFFIRGRTSIQFDPRDKDVIDTWFFGHWLSKHANYGGRSFSPIFREARYFSTVVREELMDLTGRWGIQNGLVSYQLAPGMSLDGERTFRHEIGFLGEISDVDRARRHRLPLRSWLRGEVALVDWAVARRSHKSALRLLLAGSTVDYPVQKLIDEKILSGLFEDRRGKFAPDGLHGILELMPNHIYRPNQYLQYCDAILNVPLYTPFGTWRGRAEKVRPCSKTGERDRVERQKKADTQKLLRDGNNDRKESAATRRQTLLPTAKELFPEAVRLAKEASQGRKGRPPVRGHLVSLLDQQGHTVSEREAKWLMKQLRTSDDRQRK